MSLRQLTFCILVRLDTIERLENTLAVTQFLSSNFETNIWVAEYSGYNNGLLEKLLDKNIRYSFQQDHDPILYRTKFLNQMTSAVETPFVAIWDTDVIVPVNQIVKSMKLLRSGEADFVYPYEKLFLDTSPILRRLFLQEGEIEVLSRNSKKMEKMYRPNPVGGAFLAKLKAYKDSGLENESFYGWGMEDGERCCRWENLKYSIKRVSGPLFHLSHGRGINSVYHNTDQQVYKKKQVHNVRRNKNLDCSKSGNNQNSYQ